MTSSRIELIGVAFDGWGRSGAQARAATALREAGLERAFAGEVDVRADFTSDDPTPVRASGSGLMNEAALLDMVEHVQRSVSGALAAGNFPLVYGGDCTVLLGAVPALREVDGRAGLVFLDGHEDTTSLDASQDGEAANMEIGLLLGLTGHLAPARLRRRLPALADDALAMLGMRDRALRRELNVASLADRGVQVHDAENVAADPSGTARDAAMQAAAQSDGWWLHVDLDVLAEDEFASQLVPGDGGTPGGLAWSQLTEAVKAALAVPRCRGLSVTIYDPDQDPDGSDARRIVQFVADIAPSLPG
jgi:arginase